MSCLNMDDAVPHAKEVFGEDGMNWLKTLVQETGATLADSSMPQTIDIYVPVNTSKACFEVFVRNAVNASLQQTPGGPSPCIVFRMAGISVSFALYVYT